MPSPFTPGWFPDRQHRVAREAQSQGQLDGPLPLLSRGALPTVTTFDYPNPSFAAVRAQHQVARTATDFGQWASLLPELLNKDKVFAGAGQVPNFEQQQFLPPIAKAPARENLDFIRASAFQLLKDATNPGQQSFDLPPRAAQRAATDTYSVYDASEYWMLADARNAGAQSFDLPPRAASRARDYSWSQVLIPTLVGQDAMLVGEASEDLPPRAAARARDYSVTASFPQELIGQDAMAAGDQSFELAPSAAARARDYTFIQAVPLNLLGRDAVNPGQQLSGNTPSAARRASQLTDPGVNLTLAISQAPPVIPQGLSTALSELPPRAAPRARDYSIAAGFPLELGGKDQVFGAPGEVPAYDWSYQPPKPRYQQGTGEPAQDLLGTLLASLARPVQPNVFELPPLAALRSRDYTWLQSFSLAVYFQPLPPGHSTELSIVPPRGPARARDYTLAAGFPLELIGQDATLVGEQFTDLAPVGAARARDYSLAFFAIVNTTPQRDLTFTTGTPQAKWRTGQPSSAWAVAEPDSRWSIRGPKE